MKILNKMSVEEIRQFVPDKEDGKKLERDEPFFRIVSDAVHSVETDEAIDIEISLRRCERTGFFRN